MDTHNQLVAEGLGALFLKEMSLHSSRALLFGWGFFINIRLGDGWELWAPPV
jgi:hypothetical protein